MAKTQSETSSANPSSTEPDQPPSLPQPSTQDDHRRLVALVIAAGPATLAKSVPAEQLRKVQQTVRQALATADAERAQSPLSTQATGKCACARPKPKTRPASAGGLICEGCGKMRL